MPISAYVRRLREHVGHELLLIASAGVELVGVDSFIGQPAGGGRRPPHR